MIPTLTDHNTTVIPAASSGADDIAVAAGIRVAVRQLVNRRVVTGAVANDALAALGITPLRDRFIVGMRLPVTVTVAAHTPARAQLTAAGLIVAAVRPVRVGYLRTRSARQVPARRPAAESVTASRVIHIARNPWLPTQPLHTIAATVLLSVTLTAADRDSARIDAHRQLSAALRTLPPSDVHLHADALTKSSVRNLGPEPIPATRHGR
ncbi:hypothetical protein DMB66_21345 [Actinoplanes sp. ATCC 53533]|uniref:hypothetical protein n=1 Tax=Actinoplanes sp. ATCC 53533 TaxID=1288362 RepID=UPI000F788834|nr:hypothetical protein [Actinoplanes sp. ATCC 53533]RSM64057.1 hypothetical protein DMB66_21345 [Actinoplanes sp. ATCC 53533]